VAFDAARIAGVSTYFNATQISFLNGYINAMFNATDATTASIYYGTSYNSANNSGMTRDQKI